MFPSRSPDLKHHWVTLVSVITISSWSAQPGVKLIVCELEYAWFIDCSLNTVEASDVPIGYLMPSASLAGDLLLTLHN